MKALAAHIEDVMREAAARWTLVAYFCLTTTFILIFAMAVNLDIVNGSLAGVHLFGGDVSQMNRPFDLEKLVVGFESIFSVAIYAVCIFLAVFATAHLVPRLQEKGTVDLYLSRPIPRVSVLLSRYVAGLLLAATNILYLITAIWLIVMWKTHVVHPRFFLAGAVMLFVIAVMLAFAFLVGVVTSSTAVSIMGTYGLAFVSFLLVFHKSFEAAVSKEWEATLIRTFYWIVPKTTELGGAVMAYVGQGHMPEQLAQTLDPMNFVSTGIFGVVCLALASWLFHRKEF